MNEAESYCLLTLSAAELLIWFDRFGLAGLPGEQRRRLGDLLAYRAAGAERDYGRGAADVLGSAKRR